MLNTESTERYKRKRCTGLACVLWADTVLMGQGAKKGGRDLSTKQDWTSLPFQTSELHREWDFLIEWLPAPLRFGFRGS